MSIVKDEVQRTITFRCDDIDKEEMDITVERERDNNGTEITLLIDGKIAFSINGDTAEFNTRMIAALLDEAACHPCLVEAK